MAPAFIASTALWICPEARDDDDRGLGVAALEGAKNVDAVHVREAEIEENQVGTHLVGRLEPLFAGTNPVDFDLVPGQHPRTERADVPFVVDDQDIVHSHKIAELEQPSPTSYHRRRSYSR